MSSRALRKAQREREEQEQLDKLQQQQEEEEEESEEEYVPVTTKKSAFAMLGDEDNDDNEDEDDDNQSPEDEGGVAVDEEPVVEAAPTKAPSKKKKKKKAKGKSGGVTPGTPAQQGSGHGRKDEGMDEIDAALKQLSASGKSLGNTTAGSNDAVRARSFSQSTHTTCTRRMKCDVCSAALRWKEVTTTSKVRQVVQEATEDSKEEDSRLV
jgi:hypothetical protein